jgi:hypothetical protein
MANSHPYISGAGNITAMISQLRKNFPATVTTDTVKKIGLASNNESYVINAIQFLGLIDEEGKRTAKGQEVLATHDQTEFESAFGVMVKEAYSDLFETHGDAAWDLDRDKLVNYFRKTDKTSDVIGRQRFFPPSRRWRDAVRRQPTLYPSPSLQRRRQRLRQL